MVYLILCVLLIVLFRIVWTLSGIEQVERSKQRRFHGWIWRGPVVGAALGTFHVIHPLAEGAYGLASLTNLAYQPWHINLGISTKQQWLNVKQTTWLGSVMVQLSRTLLRQSHRVIWET